MYFGLKFSLRCLHPMDSLFASLPYGDNYAIYDPESHRSYYPGRDARASLGRGVKRSASAALSAAAQIGAPILTHYGDKLFRSVFPSSFSYQPLGSAPKRTAPSVSSSPVPRRRDGGGLTGLYGYRSVGRLPFWRRRRLGRRGLYRFSRFRGRGRTYRRSR